MNIIPKKYTVTKDDIEAIKGLGYNISISYAFSLEDIINLNFPNFNISKYLSTVDTSFSPTTTNTIDRYIRYNDSPLTLGIEYYNNYAHENEQLAFYRVFRKIRKSIEIEHKYCIIPEPFRGKGLIKTVFQESLQQYVNMHAKKIIVHAGLSGGGYTWAKHGFVAIKRQEVKKILDLAESELSDIEFQPIKKIYDVYYKKYPNGRTFPMDLWAASGYMKDILMGSNWNGQLDLRKSDQFRNFKEYVYRQ